MNFTAIKARICKKVAERHPLRLDVKSLMKANFAECRSADVVIVLSEMAAQKLLAVYGSSHWAQITWPHPEHSTFWDYDKWKAFFMEAV